MVIVDANAILRIILNDNNEMVTAVKSLIRQNSVLLRNEVVAEIVYVLAKVYKVNKEMICLSLFNLIQVKNIYFESKDIMKLTLQTFQKNNIDFVDSMLYACSCIDNMEVFTFDEKLKRLIENRH
jgi:predicted nucleic-acid-binding protein